MAAFVGRHQLSTADGSCSTPVVGNRRFDGTAGELEQRGRIDAENFDWSWHISKRGDAYLRTLLIHGARIVIHHAGKRADSSSWVNKMVARRNKNIATVALANMNARTVWALLAHDREYQPDHQGVAA